MTSDFPNENVTYIIDEKFKTPPSVFNKGDVLSFIGKSYSRYDDSLFFCIH